MRKLVLALALLVGTAMSASANQYLIFTTQTDADAFVARANAATGYPHGNTTQAVGCEKSVSANQWACTVAVVWSWITDAQYDMAAEMLTSTERAALVDFAYLIAHNWYPAE